MSRSIRDLREIICVSRLNNVNHKEEFLNLSDNFLNGFVNISSVNETSKLDDSFNSNKTNEKPHIKTDSSKNVQNNSLIKRALPSIKSYANDNLEDVAQHLEIIDEKLISSWLCRANMQLQELVDWSQDSNVFVNFTNFWLVELPSSQRRDLFAMEYGILYEQINIGLLRHVVNSSLTEKITNRILNIAFWEYRSHLTGSSGCYVFLNHLDTLTSVRSEAYKSILTDVKFVSQNKKLIQYVLGVRAFALVSLWSSIINFYRNLVTRGDVQLKPVEIHQSTVDVLYTRICVAICHGFIPTLQYWIHRKKIDVETFSDEQGRNLLILAISYKNISVAQYLISNFDVKNIINRSSGSGNSALHLAVCQGSLELVKLLVVEGRANVNITNAECDNCTPLHMAAIYGQEEIASFLIKHGAQSAILTDNNNTPADMAKIYEQMELTSLVEEMENSSIRSDSRRINPRDEDNIDLI